MSTTTIKTASYRSSRPALSSLWRVVWKEYRMLRGLWLAVAAMGFAVQIAVVLLSARNVDQAGALFATALAASVLYAAGAAATSFAVEHEDETHSFLASLPATWWSAFAGKLLVSASSAALLATVLTAVGWILDRDQPLGGRAPAVVLGMLGVAVVEALAWGTLFSLIVKRPLAAALLTLIVGAVAINIAVSAGSNYAVASTVPRAYLEAMPLRLAIVGALFALSGIIARRWLMANAQLVQRQRVSISSLAAPALGKLRFATLAPGRAQRRNMLARLLWQTWRESWRLLLLPVGIAGFLFVAIAALVGVSGQGVQLGTIVLVGTLLFLPTLYGALVFSADQRRGGYRFLAEHAAGPRWVWLARHIVWLGALLVVFIALQLLLAAFGAGGLMHHFDASVRSVGWHYDNRNVAEFLHHELSWAIRLIRGISIVAIGWLTAYALGQVFSMVVRSEILAAFISLVLSTVVSAWAVVLFFWQLSGWVFLLPIALGFMLCTWLRAPDWIVGRSEWRTWLKPALAVAAPAIVLGLMLPGARLAQIPTTLLSTINNTGYTLPISELLKPYRDQFVALDTRAAQKTAELYTQAAGRFVAGPDENYLAPWESHKLSWVPGGILERTIPPAEVDSFREAERKQLEAIKASITESVQAAMEISRRPSCYFEFNLGAINPNLAYEPYQQLSVSVEEPVPGTLSSYPPYRNLVQLQTHVLRLPETLRYFQKHSPHQLEDGNIISKSFLERAMAALRMSAHIRSGQPSAVFLDQLAREQEILQWIAAWARQGERTQSELAEVTKTLNSYFKEVPNLANVLLADDRLVRGVLNGKEMPLSPTSLPNAPANYLAFAANELPWERERALRALDLITLYNIRQAESFTNELMRNESSTRNLRQWLRPQNGWNSLPENWQLAERRATTSYLLYFEYEVRVPIAEQYRAFCNNQVFRRATLLQIALARYRTEHDEYPRQLTELVPEYLAELPLDPYSGQPFGYEPDGLDLPLQRTGHVTNFERIEPGRPLFWSVGSSGSRLMRETNTKMVPGESDSPDDRIEVKEPIYRFRSDDDPWWNDPAFAFPLRK
jgi:ABC-type transport system involved in multi-copper enzyme maturation permease subunit